MGLPQTDVVTLPVDPIQLIPTYDAALAAFKQLPPVRVLFDNGAGIAPLGSSSNPGDPYRRVRARTSRRFPSRAPPRAPGTSGRAARSATRRRRAAGVNSFTANANALPLTDYGTNTGTRRVVGQRVAVAVELAAEPGGHRGLVRLRAAHRRTPRSSGAAPSTSGCDRRPPTSICRPRSARCVRTGTRRSSRTAGSARASASSRPTRTTCSSGRARRSSRSRRFTAADAAPMPAGQFVKVVVPLYYQGHAYRAGSRIRVTIAAPNGTQPIWSFGQTQPTAARQRLDRVLHDDAVEPRPSGRSRRDRADARCRRARACATSRAGPTCDPERRPHQQPGQAPDVRRPRGGLRSGTGSALGRRIRRMPRGSGPGSGRRALRGGRSRRRGPPDRAPVRGGAGTGR